MEKHHIRISYGRPKRYKYMLVGDGVISMLKTIPRKGETVFPVKDIRKSWNTAKRKAGLDSLRFTDIRNFGKLKEKVWKNK